MFKGVRYFIALIVIISVLIGYGIGKIIYLKQIKELWMIVLYRVLVVMYLLLLAFTFIKIISF